MSNEHVTLDVKIKGHPDTMKKFVRFLAMLHHNGGHSAFFGLWFDGDGHDHLKVEPWEFEDVDTLRGGAQMIADVGHDVEAASDSGWSAMPLNYSRSSYTVNMGEEGEMRMWRVPPSDQSNELRQVRRLNEEGIWIKEKS